MKIGIDISSIIYGTGVSLYTQNLVKSLYKHHPKNDYVLFGGSLRNKKILDKFSQSMSKDNQDKILPIPPKVQSFLFNQLHFPIDPITSDLDIFHSWDWYTPKVRKGSLVTTIHDLSSIKYEKQTHPEIVKKHKSSLNWIKKEARAIIAVSENTKKDIIKHLKIDPKIIHVVYEALPEEKKIKPQKNQFKKLKQIYNLTKPFFITVASFEPRKNLNRIIKAFKKYQNDYQLVLVGKSGYEKIDKNQGVIKTGFIKDQDLASLYQHAELMLYPSIYEGFGLPILEAFYHGLPIVTSNTSSMPEVAGKAAVLVDPNSVDSISKGIKQALSSKNDLINKGKKRLNKFSWEKVADETIKVYESTLEKK